MVFCNDCMYCNKLRTAHNEYFCSNFCCYIGALGCDEGTQKPQTNADRIRGMTEEELASFLWNRDIDIVEKASKAVGFTFTVDKEQCLSNVLNWLKEEAER